MKIKVDKVKIEQSWIGYTVTAYVDGEEIEEFCPIFLSELKALSYIEENYEVSEEKEGGKE